MNPLVWLDHSDSEAFFNLIYFTRPLQHSLLVVNVCIASDERAKALGRRVLRCFNRVDPKSLFVEPSSVMKWTIILHRPVEQYRGGPVGASEGGRDQMLPHTVQIVSCHVGASLLWYRIRLIRQH